MKLQEKRTVPFIGQIQFWKEASIKFKQPGRSTLRAEIKITKAETDYIRKTLKEQTKLDRTYQIELFDEAGTVCAVVEKIIHFKKKNWG